MNFPELNLNQLRTFVAAAERLSFIGAADAVHRSQAAVSMQIMKLEAALDQPLFERHTRRIALTHAGAMLLPYARARCCKWKPTRSRRYARPTSSAA
jgi:DNA-binding transcriptional LysR family regulator